MISEFYTGMKKELGENDIKLSYTWDDFIMSKYISDKIKNGKSDFDEKTLKRMQALLISKNVGDFRSKVYLPSVEDKMEKQTYTEKEFMTLPEAMQKGDDALKLLYVPPFALGLSMVGLLLNLITVMVMISALFPTIHKRTRLILKPILFALFIFMPYILSTSTNTNTPLIDEALKNNLKMERYVKFLEWLKYYEEINYKFYK